MTGLALALLTFGMAWLFHKVTTYAHPCMIGLIVARYAFETGAGLIGAIIVFGLTAFLAFWLMRWLFTFFTQPIVRIVVSLAFVTPAVVVSYCILERLSAGQIPSELWRQALCVIGASITGLMALARLVGPETEKV